MINGKTTKEFEVVMGGGDFGGFGSGDSRGGDMEEQSE